MGSCTPTLGSALAQSCLRSRATDRAWWHDDCCPSHALMGWLKPVAGRALRHTMEPLRAHTSW